MISQVLTLALECLLQESSFHALDEIYRSWKTIVLEIGY